MNDKCSMSARRLMYRIRMDHFSRAYIVMRLADSACVVLNSRLTFDRSRHNPKPEGKLVKFVHHENVLSNETTRMNRICASVQVASK